MAKLAKERSNGVLHKLLAVPGLVYRRDQVDRTHVGEPHQLDLWLASSHPQTSQDLRRLLAAVAQAVLPGCAYRMLPATHSYTVEGLQLEVLLDGEWLELAEGGLIHPTVLAQAGLPAAYGLAMGMGLDRALMVRKNVPDIRLLRLPAEEAQSQMQDLAPWRPLHTQPAARRDLSLMTEPGMDEEIAGDLVREALGAKADLVEQVTIKSRTAAADLPPQAVERLGALAGQENLLLRLSLRSLTSTLTADEANELAATIYTALHRGNTKGYGG